MQKHNSKTKKSEFFLGDKNIDMINEYTYLGLKMNPNNKFCLATKQLSEKSLHALFKIRKHLDFHKVNPKIAMKIFDGNPQYYSTTRRFGEPMSTKDL